MRRTTRSVVRILVGAVVLTPVYMGLMASASLATGDANSALCPASTETSPGFRAYLPDCRSYELVSPESTNGAPFGEWAVSADGTRVSFYSLGEFAEAGDAESSLGSIYVATRGSDGWSTSSYQPSGEQFQSESEIGEDAPERSADLSESLFGLLPNGAIPPAYRLYRLRPGTAPVEVGPVVPPGQLKAWSAKEGIPQLHLIGATQDLSRVFFTPESTAPANRAWLWPGDSIIGSPTISNSLYEYSGTGNTEPVLVDVKPGPTEARNRPAEEPVLISRCSAGLGGARLEGAVPKILDSYNAVSSLPRSDEGNVAFFTALANNGECESQGPVSAPPVDELYARIGESHTVAISEPSAADCAACSFAEIDALHYNGAEFEGSPTEKATHKEQAEKLRALFQGANQEGTKVFFLSSQRLFDGTKGEIQGHDNLYEYDFSGPEHERLSLVAPQMAEGGGVMRVAEDGSQVYLVSEAVLTGTTPNEFGASPEVGHDNLYVFNTTSRNFTFVAHISPNDATEWQAEDDRGSVQVTPDGRFLVFSSIEERVTPDATGEGRQLYRYDATPTAEEEAAGIPKLVRISIGDEASRDGNAANSEIVTNGYSGTLESQAPRLSITSDGTEVFFASTAALTPGAVDHVCAGQYEGICLGAEVQNVYEYRDGHVYLISDGRDTHLGFFGNSPVELVGASPSGEDVYIKSQDALVPQAGSETGAMRLYDARVDGGYPAPAVPAGCTLECQAPAAVPPVFGVPTSATVVGSGNTTSLASPVASKAKPKTRPLTRAQKLADALRLCRKKRSRVLRASCETRAHRGYGSKPKAKKANSNRRSGR
jgi:hypothetical protein